MKKRMFALLLTLCMAFTFLPMTALATFSGKGSSSDNPVTSNDDLKTAIENAADGDTIYLGELSDGEYTTYTASNGYRWTKSLNFVGVGDKTKIVWQIGSKTPDATKVGTEYNSDYSFGGSKKITFENMTLQSATLQYLGFSHIEETEVKNCIVKGCQYYWGYKTATFTNTTFNAPDDEYSIYTYTGNTYNFNNCHFETNGKAIQAYAEDEIRNTDDKGGHSITINIDGCSMTARSDKKSFVCINDYCATGDHKFYVNFTGTNTTTGVKPDGTGKDAHGSKPKDYYLSTKQDAANQEDYTCSRLFEFNTKNGGNVGKTVVTINGTTVWENGARVVDHNENAVNTVYTDGYVDQAFTTVYGTWTTNDAGEEVRTNTITCNYCGWSKTYTEKKSDSTEDEKTSYPGIEKKIVTTNADGKKTLVEESSIAAGGEVKFQLKSTVPQNLKDYLATTVPTEPELAAEDFDDAENSDVYYLAFHDVLDNGLTVKQDPLPGVKVKDTELTLKNGKVYYVDDNEVETEVGEYSFTNSHDVKDAEGNTTTENDALYVKLELVTLYKAGVFTENDFGTADIIVTYTATADKNLKPGEYGNTAWVEYEGGHTTEKPEVKVYSYGVKVFKYVTGDEEQPLEGATFELKDADNNVVETLTSGKNGYATTEKGLKEGTYTLTETAAPENYAKSDTPLTVEISKNNADDTYYVNAKFANSPVPHTGGQGRMMFTYAAIGLAAAAVVVLLISGLKKRKEDEENG